MQSLTITGNLGRDAELRQAGQGDVLSFSVGVKQGFGDKASSNWFRCNVWGKRGTSIAQYLTKGVRVTVQGELTIGEYQGKPQFDVRVNEVEWERREQSQQRSEPQRGGGGGGRPAPAFDLDDEPPFLTCDPAYEQRRRII